MVIEFSGADNDVQSCPSGSNCLCAVEKSFQPFSRVQRIVRPGQIGNPTVPEVDEVIKGNGSTVFLIDSYVRLAL